MSLLLRRRIIERNGRCEVCFIMHYQNEIDGHTVHRCLRAMEVTIGILTRHYGILLGNRSDNGVTALGSDALRVFRSTVFTAGSEQRSASENTHRFVGVERLPHEPFVELCIKPNTFKTCYDTIYHHLPLHTRCWGRSRHRLRGNPPVPDTDWPKGEPTD